MGVIYTSSSLLTEAYIEIMKILSICKTLGIFILKLDSEHQKAVIKDNILLSCCKLAEFLSPGLNPHEMKAIVTSRSAMVLTRSVAMLIITT